MESLSFPLSQYVPTFARLLIALACLVLPIVLGSQLAKRLRMPDYGWKFGLILFTFFTSLVILVLGWPPKLGIDLSGGVNLVYQVDQSKKADASKVLDREGMEKLIVAITQRINPGGIEEIIVRPYGVEQIEIIIPEIEPGRAEQVERKISQAGTLEFRILANSRDHKDLIDRALAEKTPVVKSKVPDEKGEYPTLAWWVTLKGSERLADKEKRAEAESKLDEKARERLLRDRKRVAGVLSYPEICKRTIVEGDKEVDQVLVVKDDQDVTGQFLTDSSAGTDQVGKPCVNFRFNTEGAARFGALTGNNLPEQGGTFTRKLGIILDGELNSAPSIKSAIHDRGEISGEFTQEEVKDLVDVLNAGSLPTALAKEPISRLYSGATLGQDTIKKSALAMVLAAILVPLFMLCYYRFSGVAADVALVLNMMVVLAIMIAVGARLTLTGLAGLALTVGMAVDNNVLVYERLREEIERGATLRMGIRNAFQRASTTIIDANLTTLIAATVLYAIGTDQIKGFAVTLWIGVAISIFTAVFVSRVIFDVAEKKRVLTEAKMLRLIGHTNIDFMGLFRYTAMASLIVTIGGLLVAAARGKSLFDIDFTGGVSVQMLFKEPQDIGDIRKQLGDKLPDLAVTAVRVQDEPENLRFNANTSADKINKVTDIVVEEYAGKLVTNSLDFVQPPTLIEESAPPPKPAAPEKGKDAEKTKQSEKPKENGKTVEAEKPEAPQKPAEKEEKTPADKTKEQSRRDLPPNTLVAMAGPAAFLLAETEEKTDVATAEKTEEKPAGKTEEKTAEKTEEKPADKTEEKPADKTEEKTAEKTEAKPADKTEEKPAAKAEEKPVEKTDSAPAGKTEEKPAAGTKGKDLPVEKPAAAPADSFVGGTQARLKFGLPVDHKTAEDIISKAMKDCKIDADIVGFQLSNESYTEGDAKSYAEWNLKIALPPEKVAPVFAQIKSNFQKTPFFPASTTIGGTVAAATQLRALWALVLSWACMIVYLWVRFQGVAFGLAAVVALIHDVFVMVGALALSYYVAPFLGFLGIAPFKINMGIVAAILTIIGFSVNDTIVIFDRIREVRGKDPRLTREMVNDSTNQTLSRTLLTSFTVLLVVVILYCFGGEELHGMAFALLVGVVTGTYSSVYVAAPILLWLVGRKAKKTHGQIV